MTGTPTRAARRGRIAALAAIGLLLGGSLALGGCYAHHDVHRRGHRVRQYAGHGAWCAAEHGHESYGGHRERHRGHGADHGYDDH